MRPNTLLKRARELRGWSQARVAEEIGTTALNVGRWERGTSMPYPHFREKLCILFGKDARELGLLEMDDETEGMALASDEEVLAETSPEKVVYDPAIPLLPPSSGRLVGRDHLLKQLKQRLCGDAKPVMIALHGLPGVGKTALAIELAYDPQVRAHFRDGILWAGPGLNADIPEQLSRWGSIMGVTTATAVSKLDTAENWARAIRTAIGQRRMLLVVDDAWKVEEALAFQVGGPHCAYLVTTRYPNLAVQLAAENALIVPELTEQDGVALLSRYASEFVRQAPEIAQALVHSVGALPLALTLVGKYLSVQVYSGQPRRLHTAVEHLRDAQARLQLSEARALAERHPSLANGTTLSLQALIAVSEQLLDEQARSALRALSLFPAKPNSFSEEAVLEICQVSVETLDALCDSGLLESNGPSRYMLHQTIADYGHLLLSDPGVSERLVRYYVHFVETHQNDHLQLELEATNILGALEIAHTTHHRGDLMRGVCALADFLYVHGLYSLARKHLTRARAAAQMLDDHIYLVRILSHLGAVEQACGHFVQAEAFLLEGLKLARQRHCEEQICNLLFSLGKVEDGRGNLTQAEVYFFEGLTLARKLDRRETICHLLTGLGVSSGKRGDEDRAEKYFQEGLVIARQLGHQERIGTLLLDLGRVEQERGNYTRAETYYQECVKVTRHFGYDTLHAVAHSYLGQTLLKQGRFFQSRRHLSKSLEVLRRIGSSFWTEEVLTFLGRLAAVENDEQQAEAYYQEALDIARRFEHRGNLGALFDAMGALETQRGNDTLAESYLRDALNIGRELGMIPLVCTALYSWGELHLLRRRIAEACLAFEEMLSLVPKGRCESEALAHYGLARAALAQQDMHAARHHGEASLALFATMGHHRADEVRAWLDACIEREQSREEKI
jgi:tetratricopeptide (TPR) repeat protein/transcriptional regulator with XRE-family HTH domain